MKSLVLKLKRKLGIHSDVIQEAKSLKATYQKDLKYIEQKIATLNGDQIWFTPKQEEK